MKASETILVTGATGGIGQAVCARLAKGGASLLLAARDAARLQSLCAELPSLGTARHTWISVDMTLDESVRNFEDELTSRRVTLDAVVLMPPQDPPTSDPLPSSDRWREILQSSFVGPLALLKAAIGTMKPDPENGELRHVADG